MVFSTDVSWTQLLESPGTSEAFFYPMVAPTNAARARSFRLARGARKKKRGPFSEPEIDHFVMAIAAAEIAARQPLIPSP